MLDSYSAEEALPANNTGAVRLQPPKALVLESGSLRCSFCTGQCHAPLLMLCSNLSAVMRAA